MMRSLRAAMIAVASMGVVAAVAGQAVSVASGQCDVMIDCVPIASIVFDLFPLWLWCLWIVTFARISTIDYLSICCHWDVACAPIPPNWTI